MPAKIGLILGVFGEIPYQKWYTRLVYHGNTNTILGISLVSTPLIPGTLPTKNGVFGTCLLFRQICWGMSLVNCINESMFWGIRNIIIVSWLFPRTLRQ